MMSDFRLTFDPLVPVWIPGLLFFIAVALGIFAAVRRMPGQVPRILVTALVLLALCRPSLISEQKTPLDDVAAIVVDRSQSQNINNRAAQTDTALEAVKEKLAALGRLDTRIVTIEPGGEDGTRIFEPLSRALSDVPDERLAGIIVITDGQIHDTPAAATIAGNRRTPLHVLLTGRPGETDRRLIVEQAPKFALLGEAADIFIRVEDDGVPKGTSIDLSLAVDGVQGLGKRVRVGERTRVPVVLTHGGPNFVELSVPPGANPLTPDNKRALIPIKGIRDRLRVLLVSGEPHPGERTWRNLLKADPSVDLVHFTILRPPEKQDGTPINELALIAFPTRELFVEKLHQFDLIIFDRYHWRGILPPAYFDNIARYVENGGSLLVSVDPSFAGSQGLYRTPLAAVLPAQPTGEMITGAFRPMPTPRGRRHPVTADLPGIGAENAEPAWGRWFRSVDATALAGETVLTATGNRPLLQLAHTAQGRVALLLSDEVWLWARGYDGGGPQAELLRRVAHWLMKEPELEEETLRANARSGVIEIERRTLADTAPAVILTAPDGAPVRERRIELSRTAPGRWTAIVPADAQGLYRLNDGILQALCIVGPPNSLEMSDVRATESVLRPIADASGGGMFWTVNGLPEFRRIDPAARAHGNGWAGLYANQQAQVINASARSLIDPRIWLLPLLSLLVFAWWREGR